MKTKILIILGIFFFANTVYSQDTYYLLQGRSEARNAVTALADAINPTNFPLTFRANEAIGDNFILTLYHHGEVISEKRFHLSDKILADMNVHIRNPQTGESINDICIRQAQAMQQVFRRGLELERQEITDLSNAGQYNQDLQRNYERPLDMNRYPTSANDDYVVITENQGRAYYPHLENVVVKEKTYFGRNLGWIIPAALAVGYLAYDGFTPGGLFDFNKSNKTTVIIIDPDDPSNPNGPGHNPNGQVSGGELPGKSFQNMALDKISQQAISSPRGIVIGINILRR